MNHISSVQSLSRVRLFATPWTAARPASLSITNFQSPPKPMSPALAGGFSNTGTQVKFYHSVQSLSHVLLFESPWTAACQASVSITNSQSLLKLMWLSQWCHPTIASSAVPFSLPSIFLSIRVFSNESVLHIRWPKFWSSSFSINPSNEYSGLISFRMDWLNLLAVRGTLKIFSNTKWADYLKRNQVQHFQGRLSGPKTI